MRELLSNALNFARDLDRKAETAGANNVDGFLDTLPMVGTIRTWLNGAFAGMEFDEGEIDQFFVNMALSSPVLPAPAPWLEGLWEDKVTPLILNYQRAHLRGWSGDLARESFYYKMYMMLADGTPPHVALAKLWFDQSKGGRQLHRPMVVFCRNTLPIIKNGGSVSQAFEGWLPSVDINMLRVADNAGDRSETFREMMEMTKRRRSLRLLIIKPFSVIGLYLSGDIAMTWTITQHVLPQMFRSLGKRVIFHGKAAKIMALGDFVGSYGWVVLLAILALIAAFFVSLPRFAGKFRRVLDRLPGWNLYRMWVGIAWLVSMASMATQGIPPKQALGIVMEVATPYLKRRLANMQRLVRDGRSLAVAMAKAGDDFPDEEVLSDYLTIARSGQQGRDGRSGNADDDGRERHGLKVLADRWLSLTEEKVGRWSKMMIYVGMIASAALLGWMIDGIFDAQAQMRFLAKARRL
ncbi:type II secretion system F family protein [Azospirillum sp. B4]|uniref:type II secretion system F family protein n=1 Tax=Azospirillum sp. B4 TaxID=95605 RepID=UPI0003449EF0|nr:type II secretion system F family protein [Azospirillum sp. B4]